MPVNKCRSVWCCIFELSPHSLHLCDSITANRQWTVWRPLPQPIQAQTLGFPPPPHKSLLVLVLLRGSHLLSSSSMCRDAVHSSDVQEITGWLYECWLHGRITQCGSANLTLPPPLSRSYFSWTIFQTWSQIFSHSETNMQRANLWMSSHSFFVTVIIFHSLDFVLFGLLQQSGKGNNEMFWKTSCPGLNLDLMFPHTWTLKFNCISHITERRNNLKNATKTPRHNPSPTTITCFHELTLFRTLSLNAMDLYSAALGGPLWWGFNQQTLRGRGTA